MYLVKLLKQLKFIQYNSIFIRNDIDKDIILRVDVRMGSEKPEFNYAIISTENKKTGLIAKKTYDINECEVFLKGYYKNDLRKTKIQNLINE